MNIENLESFLLVAENLSFARAAKALHKSQPAVTKQIRSLECELGFDLFTRSTRHVELTSGGESFYTDAKEIVMKTQAAVSRAQRQNLTRGALRIGVSTSSVLFYLQSVLKEFHFRYPDARPDILCMDYKRILNLFLEHKIDILFYYKENLPKEYAVRFLPLKKDRLSCVVSPDHPLAQRQSVSLEDLENTVIIACEPLEAPLSIAALQEKILEKHDPDKIRYCSRIETAHCLAGAGMGAVILPEMLCLHMPEYICVPLEDENDLSFGVFYHDREQRPYLEQFIKLLSEPKTQMETKI